MKILKFWQENQRIDLVQKHAWRLVRSVEDRIVGMNSGFEKLNWCVDRIHEDFPDIKRDRLEDYVRAAYMNFKIEYSTFERS